MKRQYGIVVLLTVLIPGSTDLSAQGFQWPEEPENLKVLPETAQGDELGNVMRGFARSLGVRCQYCHGPKPGRELDPMDLTTFDFASDANPMKETARLMLRMVGAINQEYLSKVETPQADRIRVECATCHRGQSRPQLE